MSLDVREWLADLYLYKLTAFCIVAQLVAISRWPHRRATKPPPRPSSDATWFVPVYVWGLESLRHLVWWLTEPHRFCFGLPFSASFQRVELTAIIMAVALAGSFLSERQARRHRRAVREAQAAVPISVVAALFGVQWTWALSLAILYGPAL
jgi:hypothetical protein